MILDISCVRDILICLETHPFLNQELEYQYVDLPDLEQLLSSRNNDYPRSQITYTVSKLKEANFIHVSIIKTETCIANFLISSITFEGHQFLDTIRPDSVWEKIRAICEKTGLKSIATIMDIADILLPDTLKKALP